MEKPTVGTFDFYFDMADALERLGVDFTLSVLHPAGGGIMVLTNVSDVPMARHMLAATSKTLRERVNGLEEPEDGQDEDPSPDQGDGV